MTMKIIFPSTRKQEPFILFSAFVCPLRAPLGKLPKTHTYTQLWGTCWQTGGGWWKMQAWSCDSCAPGGFHLAQSGNLRFQHTHTPTHSSQNYLLLQPTLFHWTKTSFGSKQFGRVSRLTTLISNLAVSDQNIYFFPFNSQMLSFLG